MSTTAEAELPVAAEPVRFHLSLNVPDLPRAVAFYRTLFGVEPAKSHDDYAKFDLVDPPVVFSLVPHAPGPGCTLSHLGLRVTTDEAIDGYRARLDAAGLSCEAQLGTVCGYAKQNKLWVQDPFGNFWEIYRIEADVPPESVRTSIDGAAARREAASEDPSPVQSSVWEHFVANELPARIDRDDASVDEVRLTGSFNADLNDDERAALLRETLRVLRPGGKVVLHGLMADRPIAGAQPQLPGLAALVSRVPVQTEPIEGFEAAGFVGAQFVKYVEKAWFTHGDAGLREIKIVAFKPTATPIAQPDGATRQVLYKGPFARAKVDGGLVFERGIRTSVALADWEALRRGPTAESFLFFDPGQVVVACSVS